MMMEVMYMRIVMVWRWQWIVLFVFHFHNGHGGCPLMYMEGWLLFWSSVPERRETADGGG